MTAPGLIVAAPRSGSGKTTVTLALIAALRRRGLAVRTAKSGPDYIDPAFHAAAAGVAGVNLDSWAMPPAMLDAIAARIGKAADIVIAEAAMGLFDGVDGAPGRHGSAADLAARFGWPVLLVLDISGQSQSAAAIATGFARFDPAVRVCGVVLNRVGSQRHAAMATAAIEEAGLPVLGCLMRDPAIALPERHLGLVQAAELADLPALLARLADSALDLDRIIASAAPAPEATSAPFGIAPPGQRIAIAADAAFAFLYPHLTDHWRAAGAELAFFSPLADEPPPADCDAAWLPGGYPELHAGRLAVGQKFMTGLRRFAETKPVHGECGGHMVLGAMMQDADGIEHPMAGLLDHTSSFFHRRMHLGYRRATLLADCAVGPAGARLRGHEFHYASSQPGEDAPLADLADAAGNALGPAGGRRGHVTGSFFHVIAPDNS